MTRAFIIMLDPFGLGATPDADKYGDAGSNTLRHMQNFAQKEKQILQVCAVGHYACRI